VDPLGYWKSSTTPQRAASGWQLLLVCSCPEVAAVTIINLPGCLHCGANPMLLLKVETTSLPGDKQTGDPQTPNPVVVCTTCGTLMVRVGGGGWMVDAGTSKSDGC
jgi:hypothetical protein